MSERLRVAFCLVNSGVGGTELNTIRTAEALDPDRFDLRLIALHPEPAFADRYAARGARIDRFPIPSLGSFRAVRQGWRLARLLRRGRVDVFHAQDSYGNIFGVPWARLAGVPVVLASRRWWKEHPRPGHRQGNRVAYRLAHGIVANSASVAELARAEAGRRVNVFTVPNFVERRAFEVPPAALGRELRRELEIPNGNRLVGIIANLRPVKDHATLLEAFRLLASRFDDVSLVIVGDGPCRSELERRTRALGLEDRVHLAGERPNRPNLHHLFDVSVLSSRSEACSNSILEAMAAARPVVATRVGGNPDLVQEGVTGHLVPVGAPRDLAESIGDLLADPARARAFGEAGQERIRTYHTPEHAMSVLAEIYSSLCGTPRAIRPGAVAASA